VLIKVGYKQKPPEPEKKVAFEVPKKEEKQDVENPADDFVLEQVIDYVLKNASQTDLKPEYIKFKQQILELSKRLTNAAKFKQKENNKKMQVRSFLYSFDLCV
jgi:hypothetical protein